MKKRIISTNAKLIKLADCIMAPGHTKAFCPKSCLTMRCFLRSSQMMEVVEKTISGTERH